MRIADVREAEYSYLGGVDWEIRENANTNLSYSNFRNYLFDKLVKRADVLSFYLPPDAVKAHFAGDIHIHKLPDSLWIPYCVGWNIPLILRKGLRTPTVISKPARHFDTAVAHLVNFFFIAGQEWTGAQAASAFDLYMAPFAASDGLGYGGIKQVLQRMLFELNYPARAGYQSPFTNITLMLGSTEKMLSAEAIVAGKPAGRLGDYLDEALLIARALCELYGEGDAVGQPFTFPIPTIMLTKNFDWNGRRWGDLTDLIFETLAKRGTFYMLNGYSEDVEALYAMCCRLTVNIEQLLTAEELAGHRQAYGIWAMPDATGSIGVVTLNMPRLAHQAKGEWETLEELLDERLSLARKVLRVMRSRYAKSMKAGFMPLSQEYLGHLNNHYNTIGVIGLPEAAANFLRNPALWVEGSRREMAEAIKVEKKMVEMVRERVEEFEDEDGCLYNVEEIPGESTSYRLAKLDMELFHDSWLKGELAIPGDLAPFYSNSVVPYYADVGVFDRAVWEGEVQQVFTGGVMMHLFLGESPDPKALKSLVRRIALNTKVVYFSITPTITVCRKCGWNAVGMYGECPQCGGEVEVWSRIVGYYRPVKNWNPGKQAEFKLRKHYKTLSLETP